VKDDVMQYIKKPVAIFYTECSVVAYACIQKVENALFIVIFIRSWSFIVIVTKCNNVFLLLLQNATKLAYIINIYIPTCIFEMYTQCIYFYKVEGKSTRKEFHSVFSPTFPE